MPRNEPLFTFRLTPILLALLGSKGKDAAELLESTGMPPEAKAGECTVPLSRVRALVDEAARRKRDPVLGLSLSSAVPEGTYDAAELLVRTAPTVGQGLAALAKHAALVNPIGQFRYDETADKAELHYVVPGQQGGLGMHMNEYSIAYILRGLRLVAERELPLLSVWFAHDRAQAKERVSAFFDCPVRFRAATSGFALSLQAAREPLRSGDRIVFEYLARQAEKTQLATGVGMFSASVARAIEAEVGFARADLQAVAKHLALTERTAQRRLREEGTQFRDVLDQARRRRAEELAGQRVPDERVADLLGFADVGSYRRAKKRWKA